ncbi:hypothetical protein D3C78_1098680 [compost metagenome]
MPAVNFQRRVGTGVICRYQCICRVQCRIGLPVTGFPAGRRVFGDVISHPVGELGGAVVVQRISMADDGHVAAAAGWATDCTVVDRFQRLGGSLSGKQQGGQS